MRNASQQIGFIFLMLLLGIIYIANAHQAERKLRKINNLKKSVQDAKFLYQEVKSEITFKSTESQLADQLKSQGLNINSEAIVVLNDEQ